MAAGRAWTWKAVLKEQPDCCACYSCFHHCPQHAIADVKGKLAKHSQYQFKEFMIADTKQVLTIEELKKRHADLM